MQYGFGSGVLYGTRNDIATQTPQRFGAFQDINIDFSGDIKELYGQNQYALDVARGKVKITGKAKFGQISARIFNGLYFGGTMTTGDTLAAYQETGTIPTTPFQITVANGATFGTDLGVRNASTGNPMTLVASGPATGQYAVNAATGVYTFATADTGIAVLIDYTYTAAGAGLTIAGGNPLMGTTPRFQGVFSQQYAGKTLTLTLYSCVASKLTLPTKLDDYVINEIDFMAFANAAGQTFALSVSDTA